MQLARLGPVGAEVPAVEHAGTWRDARPATDDFDGSFFAGDGLARLAAAAPSLEELPDVDRLRTGAPIARPGAVVCIGMNYAAHAAEPGSAPTEYPIVFLKLPNTVVGPDDEVTIPQGSTRTDWEVELGVVIGSRASYLDSPAEALAHVAGYVTANDISERAFQFEVSGGQWSKGKCCPGFSPIGPWFVSADAVDSSDLRLRTWVNGEVRQDSTTADMVFDVPTLIHHLSQYLVLEPGDLLLTGTPQGVALSGRFPYLAAGDVCSVEVAGLGRATHRFISHDQESA